METETLTVWQLANMADCASPDSPESAGAVFLRAVEASTREAMAWAMANDEPTEDIAAETADGCVPIYTRELWATFVDVGAYMEDPTELGFDGSDMEQGAKDALYMIAERLAAAIVAEHEEGDE